jgi:hypothetical protein
VFKRRGKQQQVTETEDIHIYGSFSDMGLHENLLKGIYQYGRSYVIFVFLRCQYVTIISGLENFPRPDFCAYSNVPMQFCLRFGEALRGPSKRNCPILQWPECYP